MTEEIAPQNSASAPIAGHWWECVCGRKEHAVFLPADVEPEGRHGMFYDIVNGRHTQPTFWRMATSRCSKGLGTAPVASVQKPSRKPVERPAERPVEAVRQEGAA